MPASACPRSRIARHTAQTALAKSHKTPRRANRQTHDVLMDRPTMGPHRAIFRSHIERPTEVQSSLTRSMGATETPTRVLPTCFLKYLAKHTRYAPQPIFRGIKATSLISARPRGFGALTSTTTDPLLAISRSYKRRRDRLSWMSCVPSRSAPRSTPTNAILAVRPEWVKSRHW